MSDGRPSLSELAAKATHESALAGNRYQCPHCGFHIFHTTNTWYLDGRVRRLKKCCRCGHPVNSTETFDR